MSSRAGRSNRSSGMHQDAFGTLSAQPSLQLLSQCCFSEQKCCPASLQERRDSISQLLQVCRREGTASLGFCSALMARTGVGSFCLPLRTASASTPVCPPSLLLLLLASAAPPALPSGTNTTQAPGQSVVPHVKSAIWKKKKQKQATKPKTP